MLSRSGKSPGSASMDTSQSLEKLSAAMQDVQPSGPPNTAESRKATMANMESTITNPLKGNSAFGATPMGGSVKKIIDIIANEMKPKVLDAHKADQTQLNRLMK